MQRVGRVSDSQAVKSKQLELQGVIGPARHLSTAGQGCVGEQMFACRECGIEEAVRVACAGQCPRCPWTAGRVSPIVRLIPRVPVRHWVVTLPDPWRTGLVGDSPRIARLRALVMEELLEAARRVGHRGSGAEGNVHAGGVCAVHQCGSRLDPNAHVHALLLDGAFVMRGDEASFVPRQQDPTEPELGRLARRLRRGLEELGRAPVPRKPSDETPRSLSVQHKVAPGPAVRRVLGGAATRDGVRVRAGNAVPADDRPGVARLAGYLARAEIDPHAVDRRRNDTVRYRLHRPFSDGTTHVEMSTTEFEARIRALAPGVRAARVTYHGALAPRAAVRNLVVPGQLDILPPRPRMPHRSAQPKDPAPLCPSCDRPMQLVAVARGIAGHPTLDEAIRQRLVEETG